MSTGKLIGVGLGPGDPELITLKGLKALQDVDLIFYPASEVQKSKTTSFSLQILEQLNVDTNCLPLCIPMTGKNRDEHYQKAFEKIHSELQKGKDVAVVSEGDALFYSTFGYLLKLAQEADLDCDVIPGIPAFIASGAEGERPVTEGNQALKVIARPKDFKEIEEALNQKQTLVVMKMSVLDGWSDFLQQQNRSFFYIERVGTAQQYSTSDVKDLQMRTIPYFSLIIIYG
ncbi:precorrin-2 C(20)-methyltransferase [Marinifilum caeruleilacunae]|uniref:Precorrin-2 C(20)-methyltransferase n=1 Tax=Marinifilum caeruleilacunae TaxID=2499076 RepID=A0ABX1WYA0_9BACT|nr:precorrin-2 C(20)-methyltransferase [Marinifilum caeruleilacunae]NOU61125.1 precorrin-2 C(20)-methyltransferase [Marinifilum caeruleilacunae]